MENALLVLDCTQSLPPSIVSVSKVRMYAEFLLGECIHVLQFCFKFNAGYLLMTRSLFVRLPDEFYVTNFMIAVAFDGSRKYAVGYSLFCSCFWQLDIRVK